MCCTLFLFPWNVFAEEETSIYFYPSPSNYLTAEQQEWVCDNWDIVSNASYAFSYLDSNQFILVTGWNGTTGKLWRLKPDGSYLNDGTTIDYVFTDSNNIAAIYYDSGNFLGQGVISSLSMLDVCSAYPDGFSGCPVSLNDVISNDYIASLLTYTYEIEDDQFMIYRVQHTFDVSGLSNTIEIKQIGEIKGYILTTDNYIVRTFVTEYNNPTIMSSTNGETWTYQYMDLLDPKYVSDWELVLHWSCLDTRYSSEFEALENVNTSIQSTIQQNATLIGQNESIIEQNEQLIDSSNQTNNLIENGNQVSQDKSDELASASNDILSGLENLRREEYEISSSLIDGVTQLYDYQPDFNVLSHFVSSSQFASFVVESLISYEPVIHTLVFFSLLLGFSLFIIGRLR